MGFGVAVAVGLALFAAGVRLAFGDDRANGVTWANAVGLVALTVGLAVLGAAGAWVSLNAGL